MSLGPDNWCPGGNRQSPVKKSFQKKVSKYQPEAFVISYLSDIQKNAKFSGHAEVSGKYHESIMHLSGSVVTGGLARFHHAPFQEM